MHFIAIRFAIIFAGSLIFWFFSRKSLSRNLLLKRCLQLSIYAWILSFRMKHWQESLVLLAVIIVTFIVFRFFLLRKVVNRN